MEIPKELLPYLLGQKKDASSLQDSLFRISITFAVLVTVSTVLRVWVRMRLVRNIGLDDGTFSIKLGRGPCYSLWRDTVTRADSVQS